MIRTPRERIDLTVYVRAFAVYARNPTIVVVPLLVAVIGVLIAQVSGVPGGGALGGITSGIMFFIELLLQLFALGVSLIIADTAWRRGVARFDDAWQDARRKGGEIIMAAFGFTFVLSIAQYTSQIFGSVVGLILTALAAYGLIYTIAAAAIGGVPGGAAISVSVERVKAAPIASAILTAVAIVLLFFFSAFIGVWIDEWIFGVLGGTTIVAALVDAVIRALTTGYLAIVMAKIYADISFAPRW